MNKEIQNKLKSSKNIIDMGCGNSPIPYAKTAVDCFIEPKERSYGDGQFIDVKKMENNGIRFVNAKIDEPLPFLDKEFDFAYSHHVFEHLDDPAMACKEMMRISKSGAIITPSFFSEIAFGRSYHKWLIMARENLLLFFKKRDFEDRPFGNHPNFDKAMGTWTSDETTNAFDILLNDGEWYKGNEKMNRLSGKIRQYYFEHHPIMEVNFLWEGKFDFKIYE